MMKKYRSKQTVHAEPMTLQEYTDLYSKNYMRVRMSYPPTGLFDDSRVVEGYLIIHEKDRALHCESWVSKASFEHDECGYEEWEE